MKERYFGYTPVQWSLALSIASFVSTFIVVILFVFNPLHKL